MPFPIYWVGIRFYIDDVTIRGAGEWKLCAPYVQDAFKYLLPNEQDDLISAGYLPSPPEWFRKAYLGLNR